MLTCLLQVFAKLTACWLTSAVCIMPINRAQIVLRSFRMWSLPSANDARLGQELTLTVLGAMYALGRNRKSASPFSTANHCPKSPVRRCGAGWSVPQAGGDPACGRCGNRLLRLLDPAAAAVQVAEAVGLVLPGLGQFRQTAEEVALREILLSVAVVLLSHAEVLSGFTRVVVAVVVMVTMAAVATLVTVVSQAAQDTAQHLSNERHCKSCRVRTSCILLYDKGTRADPMPDTRGLAAFCADESG